MEKNWCVCDKIEFDGKWMDGLDWVDVENVDGEWMWRVESGAVPDLTHVQRSPLYQE